MSSEIKVCQYEAAGSMEPICRYSGICTYQQVGAWDATCGRGCLPPPNFNNHSMATCQYCGTAFHGTNCPSCGY